VADVEQGSSTVQSFEGNPSELIPHPLEALFAALGRGLYPPFDGLTEILPRPPGADAAVIAFTGHHVVAADVATGWVERFCPPGDLLTPISPAFLSALGNRTGCRPRSTCLVLCATGQAVEPALQLVQVGQDRIHPRVARAQRYRTDVRVYQTPGGEALLTIGRGLAGRWEAGFEVAAQYRNRGLGRTLVAASRRLVEPGEPLFMQVAIGNITSIRAILAGGFVPVCTEILFFQEERNPPQQGAVGEGNAGTTGS
jgi:hypothetical protein